LGIVIKNPKKIDNQLIDNVPHNQLSISFFFDELFNTLIPDLNNSTEKIIELIPNPLKTRKWLIQAPTLLSQFSVFVDLSKKSTSAL
jgi:hypothetical protein